MKIADGNKIKRGQIYLADLGNMWEAKGSEQSGMRPVLILQNDIGNKHAPTTIIAPLTSKVGRKPLPTHVRITAERLHKMPNPQDSIVMLEQVRVVAKVRLLGESLAEMTEAEMKRINTAIKVSLGV